MASGLHFDETDDYCRAYFVTDKLSFLGKKPNQRGCQSLTLLQHLQMVFHGWGNLSKTGRRVCVSTRRQEGTGGWGPGGPPGPVIQKGDLGRYCKALPVPRPGPTLTEFPPGRQQVGCCQLLQEAKLEREQEQRRHTAYISELRAKLHEEKTGQSCRQLREVLIRQHAAEAGAHGQCIKRRRKAAGHA